jgi:hypothetical protein
MVKLIIAWLFLAGIVANAVAMIVAPLPWTRMLRDLHLSGNLADLGATDSGRKQLRGLGAVFLVAGLWICRGLFQGMHRS